MARAWLRLRDSNALLVATAVVAPPLAILLLIPRPEPRRTKLLGAALLLLLSSLYVRTGSQLVREREEHPDPPSTKDWSRLEEQRAEQARRPAKLRTAAGDRYWTSYRGPGTAGRYDEMPVLDSWPVDGPPLLWKQPIGEGWSSFAIADGRAFTIEQRRDRELVVAYDIEDGRELWTASWRARFKEAPDRDGPRATPAWDDGRVYAVGAAGDLVALEAATGKELWRRNLLADNHAANIRWGVAASPLVAGDLVVTRPGAPGGQSVVAYDKRSGEPRWHALSDSASYTTPMAVTLAGTPQILVVTASRVVGLAPRDGTLLWEHPWAPNINAAQPIVVGDDRFIVSAGYDRGAMLVEISRQGDVLSAHKVWESKRMKNKLSSSVYRDGYLYGLDEGILACVDAATGELRWKGGRYGHGQLLLAQDLLIVLTEKGELALVEAKPEAFVERSRFAAIDGRTWNNPAIASGILLVRNAREMAAYRVGAQRAAGA